MRRRAWHRIRQFLGAIRPRVSEQQRREAYAHLNQAQRRLFESMTIGDQQHGLAVYRRVRAASPEEDPNLFVAALLHDCGKGHVRLWHRVANVILGRLPGARDRLAMEGDAGWRGALWRLLHHPRLGAELVTTTGADPDVVRMIEEQEAPAPDARLSLLKAADDA
jgi:hypothetical protein